MDIQIRPAAPNDGERLREIAVAAKSYWGYDIERVRRWASVGDFSPEGMRRKVFFAAEVDDEVVGWSAVVDGKEACWLDDLWVLPSWMRRGVGRRLFESAVEHARQSGATRIEWEAERNALGFYEKMGGSYLREGEPGAWGRSSPVMALELRR
jgi:GNAT superfamily N-acetyltransferase